MVSGSIFFKPFHAVWNWLKRDEKKAWYEFRWWYFFALPFCVYMAVNPTSSIDQAKWVTAIIVLVFLFFVQLVIYFLRYLEKDYGDN